MEKTLTDKMYSTITNKRFFEQEVLNSGSEHYFYYKIQNFTKYKNSLLITNEELKHRYEVLSVFNNQIQSIMFEIIVSYRLVIDCNKTNEKLHFDGLKIRLNSKLEYINRFFIPSIRYNYDDNHLLGYKMNEYCISAFDTMFDKLENDYMIDIKKSPLFSSIENVYNKYLKLFDVEKMKVLSIPMHKPQQKETKEPQQKENSEPDEVEKKLRNDIFKGNAIELFSYYYDCKSMVNNSRAHFRFLFEVMKEDGFIHDTVTLGQYIKFITKDFGYVDTELKSINLNSKPNIINLKDYNRYKENLKTTLK